MYRGYMYNIYVHITRYRAGFTQRGRGSLHPRTDREHQGSFARRDPWAGHASSQNDRLLSPSPLLEVHGLTSTRRVLHNKERDLPTNCLAHGLDASNGNQHQHHRTPTHTEAPQKPTKPTRNQRECAHCLSPRPRSLTYTHKRTHALTLTKNTNTRNPSRDRNGDTQMETKTKTDTMRKRLTEAVIQRTQSP